MCSGGQLSNRLICLRRTFMDGALLGRKVILPATGIDYNYGQLLGKVNLKGTLSASEFCYSHVLPCFCLVSNSDFFLTDLESLELCFGDKVVLTLAEFEAQGHSPLHINHTYCHRHVYDVTIPPSCMCTVTRTALILPHLRSTAGRGSLPQCLENVPRLPWHCV